MSSYRPNVGAVLRRNDGLVLMCHSVDGRDYPWQFPQGGVQVGESLEEAMWREIAEELGLVSPRSVCRLVGRGPAVRYEFVKPWQGFVGQEQTLFVLAFEGTDADFRLDFHHQPEFDGHRWVTLDQALELIVPAKRRVVRPTFDAIFGADAVLG